MSYHRILTIQDISCVGQCSMTVALPVLSACGQEVCILPSAVLSTHTGGFGNVVFRDLSQDMPAICNHWIEEGITFDAIYTGYLGSVRQIQSVMNLIPRLRADNGILMVDPAMADHGKLYRGLDEDYVRAMGELCACADVLIPNLTEACLLTGSPVKERFGEEEIACLLEQLAEKCQGSVVLTGVGYQPEETGVALWENGEVFHYSHEKVLQNYHGTGDLFAAALVGSFVGGKNLKTAVKIAADFTKQCVQNTYEDPAHWYGVKFETALPALIKMLK